MRILHLLMLIAALACVIPTEFSRAQEATGDSAFAPAISLAGGWKSPSVVLRYVENAATRELHERRWELTKQLPKPSLSAADL
jgi:hypothetical protein